MTIHQILTCRLVRLVPILALGWLGPQCRADYLRAAGPAPLQWKPLVVLRPELVRRLPPLARGDETSSLTVSNAGALTQGNLVPGPTAADTNALAMAASTPADTGQAGPLSALPELVPQLFGTPPWTNATPTAVGPNFMPPLFPPARSSSAIYSTEKP